MEHATKNVSSRVHLPFARLFLLLTVHPAFLFVVAKEGLWEADVEAAVDGR